MVSKLWRRWIFGSDNKNVRRDMRLKPPRVLPSLEWLENRELLSVATPQYLIESTQQATAASGTHPSSPPAGSPPGFSPSQIQAAYGFNQISSSIASYSGSTLPGAGQTIAIVDAYNDPDIYNNLETFDAQYGLVNPTFTLTVVNQSGQVLSTNGVSPPPPPPGSPPISTPSGNSSWAVEESLDVEWAHAIAPGANIVLVEANSSSMSDLLTAVTTASTKFGASVVSMSWGGNESSGETSDDRYFDTSGVTYVAASGDSGSSGAPIYPAVSPNVLAVGGTTLTLNSSGGYGSETAWSDSGGGISSYESRPSYQPSTYSNGSTTGTSTMRMSPDVSYDANPNTGFAVYDTDGYSGWLEVGGTSDAAPQWAALVAIADQGRVQQGESTLNGSQTLSMLYQMPSSNFHEITSGSNGMYSAGPGYNLVTGLGTPIANDVVAYLVSGSSTSPPPAPPSTPAAPTGLTATAESSSVIDLSWNPDSSASDGFLVYRSTSASSGFSEIGSTAAGVTTYSNTGLNANTTYYYEVFAVNASGESGASNVASATTSPSPSPSPSPTPAAPTGLTASAVSSSQINLSWNPDSGASDGFLVYRSTNASSGFSEIGSTAAGVTTYSSTGLNADTTYYYEVFAVNASGESGASNVASATTPPSSPPSPPPSPPPSSGLLQDGGFESPVLSPNTYVLRPAGTPWTFYGTAGIASNGSYVTGDNPPAPQGSQVGFLSGYESGFIQTVYLSAGTDYTIRFDAANAGIALPSTQPFAVAVDGTILGMGTAASTQYTSYSTGAFSVTASGNYPIMFVGTNFSSGIVLIDNVSLGATPAVKLGGSNSGGSAMVLLSGSSSPSVNTFAIGTPSPSTGSPAPVVSSPAPVVSGPAPVVSGQLPQPNVNLGLLTNLSSTTSLPLIDQLFIQAELDLISEFNSLLSLSDFGALLARSQPQAASDPFAGSSAWLV